MPACCRSRLSATTSGWCVTRPPRGPSWWTDRAGVQDAADTTVVLSLKTLHETLVDVIQKAFDAAKRRGRPADLLLGLPPGTVNRAGLELDFDGVAKAEADEGAELRFVKHAP